ncbi:MAG TPA: DUF2934 domain-containing protein [Bradyrhizobium sp.]|nr:DUF2934 domain-containing protein [Bradyrhizobium sp.]
MDSADGQTIRSKAHELWEQAGKPEGQEEHFWHEAERQLKQQPLRHELKMPDTL